MKRWLLKRFPHLVYCYANQVRPGVFSLHRPVSAPVLIDLIVAADRLKIEAFQVGQKIVDPEMVSDLYRIAKDAGWRGYESGSAFFQLLYQLGIDDVPESIDVIERRPDNLFVMAFSAGAAQTYLDTVFKTSQGGRLVDLTQIRRRDAVVELIKDIK